MIVLLYTRVDFDINPWHFKCKDFFVLFSSCSQGPVVTDNDNFILDCQFDKVKFQMCNSPHPPGIVALK